MSGSHYDYKYNQLNWLADEIKEDIEVNILESDKMTGNNYFYGSTSEERAKLKEIMKTIEIDLRNLAKRCKDLEWVMSGDNDWRTLFEEYNTCSHCKYIFETSEIKEIKVDMGFTKIIQKQCPTCNKPIDTKFEEGEPLRLNINGI